MFQNKPLIILIGVLFGLLVAIIGVKNLNMFQNIPHIDVSVNFEWSSKPKNENENLQSTSENNRLQLKPETENLQQTPRINNLPQKTETNNSSAKQKIEELLLEEGLKFYEQKRYNEAMDSFDKVIEMNPNNDIAYTYRGKCWFVKEYGIKDFDRAIEINPSNDNAYNARGYAYTKLENYEQTVSDFNISVKLNPNFYKPYVNRAIYYIKLNQYDAAIADCNKKFLLCTIYMTWIGV